MDTPTVLPAVAPAALPGLLAVAPVVALAGLAALLLAAIVSGDALTATLSLGAARVLSTLPAISLLGAVAVAIAGFASRLPTRAAPILSKRSGRQNEQQRHRRHSEGRHAPSAT